MDFKLFSEPVRARYDELAKGELFIVDVIDPFETYLAAFPEGTNPVFRERTEHDCSCCKQFIRTLGRVVAIQNGEIQTIWDVANLPEPYATVAASMAQAIRQAPIAGVFRTKEHQFGTEYNRAALDGENGSVTTFYHFCGRTHSNHLTTEPDTVRGQFNTTADVFRRGLKELKPEAVETVLDLIRSNSIYRGQEHLAKVEEFRELQLQYLTSADRELFIWANLLSPAARFRNSVIGSLITDISDGIDVERAVRSFEAKVAPENYKRTTAIITPKMVEQAVGELRALGLEDAVNRRFATIHDLSVNDVLFVDNSVRQNMADGLTSLLMPEARPPVRVQGKEGTPISMADFLSSVVPQAKSIDLLLENRHLPNFVSLTAGPGDLFRWGNGFAWSYDGDVTDSIREKVKRAGGNVTNAALRVSLAWSNSDDLDIHAHTPEGHIYFGHKAGVLDVDMNAFGRHNSVDPVENLSWIRLRDGPYRIDVNQYHRRSSERPGFQLELEFNGQVQQFTYAPGVSGTIQCISFVIANGELTNLKVLDSRLVGGSLPTEKWGVVTGQPVPVDTMMLSPNYWEGSKKEGNQHWFFILKECHNPGSARGIYNEFLRSDLEKHRKVFEVLGAKTKCPPAAEQLSGVGFSSTRGDTVTAIVNGGRAYTIQF